MNLNSNGFKLPVYIAKGVATSGHIADIGPLQVGIYDVKTNHVATASGNGKEFVLVGGSPHTKDQLSKFYHGMQHRKESTPFYGYDIESFEKAYPTRPASEQWTLGYGGGKDDTTLKYECNKTYKLKVRLFGETVFRTLSRSVERTIPLTTKCCDTDPCDYTCTDELLGAKTQTREWVKAINANLDFQEIKLKAYPIFSDYAATTATVNDFTLTLTDAGNAEALQDVQRAYPTLKIERLSHVRGSSVYVVRAQADAPANYTPKTYTYPVVNCDECEVGTFADSVYTYLVSRPVASTTDLDDDAARATYAASIVTAYTGTSGSGVYLGLKDGNASVKFNSTAAKTALLSDVLEQLAFTAPTCTVAAASAVAWVEGDGSYTITRTMKITVSDEDCTNGATVADIENHLSSLKNPVVVTETTDTTGTGIDRDFCVKTFQVVQTSFPMKDEYCMTVDNEQFEDLPGYKGSIFEEVVVPEAYNAGIKTGIRFVAPLYSESFSDFSYELGEYYDSEPVRMEVSIFEDDVDVCTFDKLAKPRRVITPKYQRLFGEWVLRMYIERNKAYFPYEDFSNEVRMREVMDNTALEQVNRKAYYVMYTLKYKEARDAHNFNQKKQHWEPIVFIEEGDKATQIAFENAIHAVSGRFGVGIENRGSL